MNYTHQDFIADVKRLVADKLAGDEASYVLGYEMRYLCTLSPGVAYHQLMTGQDKENSLLNADTIKDHLSGYVRTELYASGEPTSPIAWAYVIIHELAHALAIRRKVDDGHGPQWAQVAWELGIAEQPFGNGTGEEINPNVTDLQHWLFDWSDVGLREKIKALPAFTDVPAISVQMHALGYREDPDGQA